MNIRKGSNSENRTASVVKRASVINPSDGLMQREDMRTV